MLGAYVIRNEESRKGFPRFKFELVGTSRNLPSSEQGISFPSSNTFPGVLLVLHCTFLDFERRSCASMMQIPSQSLPIHHWLVCTYYLRILKTLTFSKLLGLVVQKTCPSLRDDGVRSRPRRVKAPIAVFLLCFAMFMFLLFFSRHCLYVWPKKQDNRWRIFVSTYF